MQVGAGAVKHVITLSASIPANCAAERAWGKRLHRAAGAGLFTSLDFGPGCLAAAAAQFRGSVPCQVGGHPVGLGSWI